MSRMMCVKWLLVHVVFAAEVGLGFPSWTAAQSNDLRIPVGDAGLYGKVIVDKPTRLHEQLGDKGIDVDAFVVFHLLYVDDKKQVEKVEGGDTFYRVGSSTGTPLGWIRKDCGIKWNTRLLLDPQLPDGDAIFTVRGKYENAQFSGLEAKYTGAKAGFKSLAPILSKPQDEDDPVYNVAIFAGDVTGGSVAAGDVDLGDLKLEIMFVIDTTRSMTPLLEGTKEVIRTAAKEIASREDLKGRVRLGLVEYQDATPGLKPANMISKLTEKLDGFLTVLTPLKVAPAPSEETKEDVLAGLKMAINDSGWEKVSSKHIILLGDASAHLTGPKNTTKQSIRQVIDLGRRSTAAESEKQLASINFHAVRADQPGDADVPEATQHFHEIAGNNGDFAGAYLDLDPNSTQDRDKVTKQLVGMLFDAFEALSKASGGKRIPAKEREVATPVAKSVYKITDATSGKAEPVVTGWAKERSDKQKQVARQRVLVTQKELYRLRNRLDGLYRECELRIQLDQRGNAKDLLANLQQSVGASTSGQTIVAEGDKLTKFIDDLPLKPEALDITVEGLARAPADEFQKWIQKLKKTAERVETLEKKADWIDLEAGKTEEKYVFLLLADLP